MMFTSIYCCCAHINREAIQKVAHFVENIWISALVNHITTINANHEDPTGQSSVKNKGTTEMSRESFDILLEDQISFLIERQVEYLLDHYYYF